MSVLLLRAYVYIVVIGIQRMSFFVNLSGAYQFTSKQADSSTEGVTVYPQVYESRQENLEKLLVIDGYSLNLKKASVLADTVLLLEVTENGTAEQYVQGSHYERHLFEDPDKLASLLLKPVVPGNYHVTGMVNHTHRIEPCENWERTSQKRLAHRISRIHVETGIYDVVNDVESRDLPESYTVETHFITALNHTAYFGNETEERIAYAMLFMHSVSLRLQQLVPPARIALTAIEGLQAKTDYLHIHDDGRIMVDQTLSALGSLARTSEVHKKSDILYMAVSAGLVKIRRGKNLGGTLGIANKGKACRNGKAALGLDRPVTFSGVQTSAHEIAHLLNADHDGHGTAKNCSGDEGYIMSSPRRNGNNSCAFSNCSKNDIADFLTWRYSKCLFRKDVCHVISLPNKAADLPGDVMDGQTFCKEYYREPRYLNSTYIKLQSDLEQCVFRCLVHDTYSHSKMQNRTSFAIDGTPCSETEPQMICHNMVCVKP
ncbi:venom metalloproteinase antarease TserMP_A-like isoform X2 [Rhipicephalus microplus]|uniref:venom metalloproteinase antarease TserMP_A-like isoform X2 n=1 Tax=Rhipicephalus microplus TaxID=6941 RepID=UPI003F6C0304